MIKVIGVDVGYGHTKAVVDGKPTIFPSLVGPARVLSFRLTDAKDLPGEDITIQGKSFFVGKKESSATQSFQCTQGTGLRATFFRLSCHRL